MVSMQMFLVRSLISICLCLGIALYILQLFHTIHSILQPISDYRQWVTETVGTVYIA